MKIRLEILIKRLSLNSDHLILSHQSEKTHRHEGHRCFFRPSGLHLTFYTERCRTLLAGLSTHSERQHLVIPILSALHLFPVSFWSNLFRSVSIKVCMVRFFPVCGLIFSSGSSSCCKSHFVSVFFFPYLRSLFLCFLCSV